MSVRAGIVVTGTEVLTGRTSDRNGPWVSERLGELGIEVAHILVVGDRPEDLLGALRFCADRELDLIVTTGGLGPTADDLTAQIVGDFAGRELCVHPEMEGKITRIIEGFARRMQLRPGGDARRDPQAGHGARGSEALGPGRNRARSRRAGRRGARRRAAGTAARAAGHVARCRGDAGDRRPLIERAPEMEAAAMKMFGIPESTLAKSLREIEHDDGVALERIEITTCLRRGAELEIDVSYAASEGAVVEGLFAGLRARHGEFIYTETGETIDEIVARLLADGGHRLATGESCTAGLLAARITDRPGSSAYFSGGVVAYSNEAKSELLGVDPGLLATHGAVSTEVAEAMADGAIERFGASVGVGITGVAGPEGGTESKPVGYVCFCVKEAPERGGRAMIRDPKLPGGRGDVRDRSVSVALHMIRRLLLGEVEGGPL